MSGSIAKLLAGVRASAEGDYLALKRDAEAFGTVRPCGRGWKWELHPEGLPGALAALVPHSETYLSERAAWLGLMGIVSTALRGLKETA